MLVFDWDKAAQIIKEKKPKKADAGLIEDWFWTGGTIYEDGSPVMDMPPYLASDWATPVLDLGDITIKCFREIEDSPGWDANTLWPSSAIEILNA